MQCGVACLHTICTFYGLEIPIQRIEEYCSSTIQGVSLLALSKTAEHLGFRTFCALSQMSDLKSAPLPCILHWNQNHYVVLFKICGNNKRYYISDPAKGIVKLTTSEFRDNWVSTMENNQEKGVALFLTPNGKMNNSSKERIHSPKVIIYKNIIAYRKYFSILLFGLLIGCVLQVIFPFLTKAIVDLGIRNHDISFIKLILLGELMIIIAQVITDFIRRRILLHVSLRINLSLINQFLVKLLKLPMSFFDTKLMGDLIQRIGDHKRVQAFLTGQLLSLLFSTMSLSVLTIILFILDKYVLLTFVIGSTLYGLWTISFLRRRRVIDYELFSCEAMDRNRTYQFITSMQEIKIQQCQERRREEWEDTQSQLFDIQFKSLKLQQSQEAGSIFINELTNIIITIISATSVINGYLSLGGMMAIQFIIGQLNAPIGQLMSFIYTLQDLYISVDRINEIHCAVEEEELSPLGRKSFDSDKSLYFTSVHFKYDRFSKISALKNISFTIPEGRITAIVGASGSGKTTLMKLLLGYYRPTDGMLRLGKHDINDYSMNWWRNQCGVVLQDGILFSESIARNIAVGDEEIDTARLEEAARLANIHDFIMSLPLNYNTIVGRDGVGISQGQKQRILIARAVYKNPSYLFLDEATNALDALNENVISTNLNEFYKNRTVVVIAHRLSTVKNAHQIIVLEKGEIVEIGTHKSLIEKKGYYFRLIKNQLELGS